MTIEEKLDQLVRLYLPKVKVHPLSQTTIPRLAKDHFALKAIEKAIKKIPTTHTLTLGDGRDLSSIPDESIHLIGTSPPYWDLKEYPKHHSQLGMIHDYDIFLKELHRVWAACFRILVKGGRLLSDGPRCSRFRCPLS